MPSGHTNIEKGKKKTVFPLNWHFSVGIPLAFWLRLFLVGSTVGLTMSPYQFSLSRGALPALGPAAPGCRGREEGWGSRQPLSTTAQGQNTTGVEVEPPRNISSQQDLVHYQVDMNQ